MKVVDLASFNSEYNKICKNGWTAIGTSSFTGELTDFEYARNLAMNCGGSLVLVARKFADTETRYEAVPVATTSGSTVTVDDNTRGNIYGNYGSYSGTYSESSTRNVHISGETIYAHKPYNVKLYDHVSAFFVKE